MVAPLQIPIVHPTIVLLLLRLVTTAVTAMLLYEKPMHYQRKKRIQILYQPSNQRLLQLQKVTKKKPSKGYNLPVWIAFSCASLNIVYSKVWLERLSDFKIIFPFSRWYRWWFWSSRWQNQIYYFAKAEETTIWRHPGFQNEIPIFEKEFVVTYTIWRIFRKVVDGISFRNGSLYGRSKILCHHTISLLDTHTTTLQ